MNESGRDSNIFLLVCVANKSLAVNDSYFQQHKDYIVYVSLCWCATRRQEKILVIFVDCEINVSKITYFGDIQVSDV